MIQTPHQPRKRFGQHFLHERGIIAKIIRTIDAKSGDRIVEIGPGLGALTVPLLEAVGRLEVVELDRDVIPRLQERCEGLGELVVHPGDALRFDFTALAAGGRLRLVGNLPYNISSPILFHALEHAAAIRDMHFMLQKEVVDRMGAAPGSKVYGRLSVMLQAVCRVEPLFDVPPAAFRPPPKVDSAVVRLLPLPATEVGIVDPALFARVVREAFGQRRKTLRNALQAVCDADALAASGIRPDLRAEQVPVASFVALANALAAAAPAADFP